MRLTEEELGAITYGDGTDRLELVCEQFEEASRWHNRYLIVIRDKKTGGLWGSRVAYGATEVQEHDFSEAYDLVPLREVATVRYEEDK